MVNWQQCVLDQCTVTDIPPFGPPDPVPLDMTIPNISPATRAAADCLKRAMGVTDDTAVFDSGYRDAAYQEHFHLLAKKKIELEDKADPLCAELKAKIDADYGRHKLKASKIPPPLDPGCHAAGTCFDVHSARIPAVDQASFLCRTRRPLRIKDPVHVVVPQ